MAETAGLWSVAEAAKYIGFSQPSVYRWAKSGKIPCVRIGDSIRFKKGDLDEWMKSEYLDKRPENYCTIETDIEETPEFKKFIEITGGNIGESIVRIVRLVGFLAKQKEVIESLENVDKVELAKHCYWEGDPELFASALEESGFIIPEEK